MKKGLLKINKGITLIEIVIAIAIFSLIMGLISSFSKDLFYYENVFSSGLTVYDNARKVLQPITSEIRSASPSSLGSYPIEVAEDNNFIFYKDIDNNEVKEKIRYFLLGDILMRGVTVPTGNPLVYLAQNEILTEVIYGVQNGIIPIFSYYNTNYDGSSPSLLQPVSAVEVRLVKITLILDVDPNKPPASVTVTTQVSLRNLKDNL